mmetsp:Transcript_28720/g.77315  ORF Transcript_28720/g.77315 Transcript_28720/m.77315 type:complete len:168 (-) Transcript_28720:417-920(-)
MRWVSDQDSTPSALNIKVRGATEAADRRKQFESELETARRRAQVAKLEGEVSSGKAEALMDEAEATMARLMQEEEDARTIRLTEALTARVMVPNAPLNSDTRGEAGRPRSARESPEGLGAGQAGESQRAGVGLSVGQKVTAGVVVAAQLLLLVALSADPMASGPTVF